MDYLSGWCKSQRKLEGCTAVITGCNTGIGKETASDLYSRGARVIMACRNIEKAEEARKMIIEENECKERTGSLAIEHLDLCSLKSVHSCALRILEKEKTIQILINNAGVMMCPKSKTEDGFETQFGSNHLAHAYFTLLLLPRLIKSGFSRIVFVSSLIHCSHETFIRIGNLIKVVIFKMFQLTNNDLLPQIQTWKLEQIYGGDFDDVNYERTPYSSLFAYAGSKSANILFAKALAMKLKELNINNVTTYSLHPGVVKTAINQHFDKTAFFLINTIFKSVLTTCFWKSPRCGAQTSIYCAVDEECAEESGLYYSDCAKAPVSPYCRNEKNAIKLWDLTIKMLKLENFNPFAVTGPVTHNIM